MNNISAILRAIDKGTDVDNAWLAVIESALEEASKQVASRREARERAVAVQK